MEHNKITVKTKTRLTVLGGLALFLALQLGVDAHKEAKMLDDITAKLTQQQEQLDIKLNEKDQQIAMLKLQLTSSKQVEEDKKKEWTKERDKFENALLAISDEKDELEYKLMTKEEAAEARRKKAIARAKKKEEDRIALVAAKKEETRLANIKAAEDKKRREEAKLVASEADRQLAEYIRIAKIDAQNVIANQESVEQDYKNLMAAASMSSTYSLPRQPTDTDMSGLITVEATAYTAFCNGCTGITKTGIDVRTTTPKIIAVDPTMIPLKSKVEIFVDGMTLGVFSAEDIGGDIKGNRIDILHPDKPSAYKFGRRDVQLKILSDY